MFILLDTGPLGMITNPRASTQNRECAEWLGQMLNLEHQIVIPEISDYELRRELLRAKKKEGLERLNTLVETLTYLPISTVVMRTAAELWARARNEGTPTAPMEALDADVILAAQAMSRGSTQQEVIVATTNVGHLSLFVAAKNWPQIG